MSVVIVDFNGDGFVDIYVCNYVVGFEFFELICEDGGVVRVC